MTTVQEIMITNVMIIDVKKTIMEGLKKMDENDIGSLVVIHNGVAVGIITSSDILYKAVVKEKNIKETAVEKIMSKELITISPDADIQEAAKAMSNNGIKKLPVITQDGELIGIITATDLIEHSPEFSSILVNLDLPNTEGPMGS